MLFARIGATMVFLTVALALVFAGVLLVAFALAGALAPHVGQPWANAITGGVFLVPPLMWAVIVSLSRPAPPPPPPGLLGVALGMMGRGVWGAIVSGAISGAVDAYLSRNRRRK
jgi:drug/metabolite transporter superfamily protein YnfA